MDVEIQGLRDGREGVIIGAHEAEHYEALGVSVFDSSFMQEKGNISKSMFRGTVIRPHVSVGDQAIL